MSTDDLSGRPYYLTPPSNNRNNRGPLDDPNKRVPKIPNQPPGPNDNRPRVRIPGWVWWILLAGLLVWNILALANPFTTGRASVAYSDFINQVNVGNVSEVTLQDRNVTGSFKQPVKATQNGDIVSGPGVTVTPPPASTPTSGNGSSSTANTAKSITDFKTTLPVIDDPTLLPLLQKQGVKVNVKG